MTHASSAGRPSTPAQARAFLRALIVEAAANFWMPQQGFWERLTQLAADLDIRGPRVFDLQIALTASDNGADEIWTHDSHFVAIPGVRIHDPL